MSDKEEDDITVLGVKTPDGEVQMFKKLHETYEETFKFFPGAGDKLGGQYKWITLIIDILFCNNDKYIWLFSHYIGHAKLNKDTTIAKLVTPSKRSIADSLASKDPKDSKKKSKVAKGHLLELDSDSTEDYLVADIIMESNKGLIHYLKSYATYNRLSFTLAVMKSNNEKSGAEPILKSHHNNKNNIANQIDIVVNNIIAAKEVILPNFEGDYSYLNGVGKDYSCLIHAYFLNYPGYELGMKKKK